MSSAKKNNAVITDWKKEPHAFLAIISGLSIDIAYFGLFETTI